MSTATFHPFPYDPFQQRAIDAIERGASVFVAAPTGSGKTVLADYVIERTLALDGRVIYTAPIKALSNQKFRDFSSRHPGQVGIMTGDVTINPTAPLLIMTTEIYRNTLLEREERLAPYAWVIFDEIHYLDDPERGTVWEEALLFTPPHINLLCLSATVPNVEEIARWIREIHGRPVEVIEESRRPVDLQILFQCQDRVVTTPQELKRLGYDHHLSRHHAAMRRADRHSRRHRWEESDGLRPNRLDHLVRELDTRRHLPCILFTFGRRRAEDLALEVSALPLIDLQERRTLRGLFDSLCDTFQLGADRTVEALRHLIDRGVAYHHAGMLPTVKEVVERCFTSRLLKLIVTTETFALGVNMPARSVVLDALKKRSDQGFVLLRRREFLQMAGRAGRRGMDEAGFVYLRINPRQVSFPEVAHLLSGPPEPVLSRFNTAYATLLNLYRRHGEALIALFPKTLYYFQTTGARRQEGLASMQRKLHLLRTMDYLTSDGLTAKGEFASWLYGYELLLTELYVRQQLSALGPLELAILMTAIVYEPKPRAQPPKRHRLAQRLAHLCQEVLARIHRQEAKLRVMPQTKLPAFALTHALDAWMQGMPFERLSKLTDVDEGEIVRYFRMAVQLLRQLADTPAADEALRRAAATAVRRINRDVIDAEAQLRLGVGEA